jgi:hypothetical protein
MQSRHTATAAANMVMNMINLANGLSARIQVSITLGIGMKTGHGCVTRNRVNIYYVTTELSTKTAGSLLSRRGAGLQLDLTLLHLFGIGHGRFSRRLSRQRPITPLRCTRQGV